MSNLSRKIAVGLLFCAAAVTSAVSKASADQGSLVKSDANTAVYYQYQGKRYTFPTERIFYSWYRDFSSVQTLPAAQIASIPLAGNVTYRPGERLVKITTDPKVYAVSTGSVLRWVASEELARTLYGAGWASRVDDVPDVFFTNYTLGSPITQSGQYSVMDQLNASPEFGVSMTAPVVPAPAPAPPTVPVAEVRADNWREKAMALPIVSLVRSVDADNRLHFSSDGGKYEFILPNIGPDAEAYGYYGLYQLKLNTEATQAALGREPYQFPSRIVSQFVIDPVLGNRFRGTCCGSAEEGLPLSWYFANEEFYRGMVNLASEPNAYLLRYWNEGRLARGDHELMHRFIRGQFIYNIFDEGLANYVPIKLISGEELSYECRPNGYIQSRNGIVLPYVVPSVRLSEYSSMYPTGECFWQILEETYGRQAIPEIFARLQYLSRTDLVSYSLEGHTDQQVLDRTMTNAVVPVVGPTAWSVFAGFGASEASAAATAAIWP